MCGYRQIHTIERNGSLRGYSSSKNPRTIQRFPIGRQPWIRREHYRYRGPLQLCQRACKQLEIFQQRVRVGARGVSTVYNFTFPLDLRSRFDVQSTVCGNCGTVENGYFNKIPCRDWLNNDLMSSRACRRSGGVEILRISSSKSDHIEIP